MGKRIKKVHTQGLDGEVLIGQLSMWQGEKKNSYSPGEFITQYTKSRNKVLADLYPYLLNEYEDFLNLDYRKRK